MQNILIWAHRNHIPGAVTTMQGVFQTLIEYRAKVAAAANTLSLCGCRPVENQKTVDELDKLVRKITMYGE